jgi:50S ribosomal protein L16 3-hydroxylase
VKASFLGGLKAGQFLRDYWQKKPLLIRNAFPGFEQPFLPADVMQLATRDDAESRLVQKIGKNWALEQGPFTLAQLKRLPRTGWTVLVQDTQHFSRCAKDLLQQFSFIPHARVDDLMVSYAKPGGGVGPHYDSYDVFLLQGSGRRRWQISAQHDLSLRPGLPLKILANFKPEQEWVLEQGDMLYLPPGYAHDGVALDDCLTYSFGFRAPSNQELAIAFLDFLRDEIDLPGQYGDPGLRVSGHPGEIPAAMRRSLRKMLRNIRWDEALMERFIGSYLSEPKAHVFFEAPEAPVTRKQFERQLKSRGVSLDPKTRMLFSDGHFFINGENVSVAAEDAPLLHRLADDQRLPAAAPSHDALALLYDWYLQGYLSTKTT